MSWTRTATLGAGFAMAVAVLPSCLLGYEQGMHVELALRAELRPGRSIDGTNFTGMEGEIHLGAISLVSCDGAPSVARVLSSIGLGRAHAHHGTALGNLPAGVWPLAREGMTLGTVPVLADSYCAVAITVLPSDARDSALGEDETLWLTGRAEREGRAFAWQARGPGNLEVTLPLVDEAGLEHPLRLDAAHRAGFVEVRIDGTAMLAATPLTDRDPVALALDLMVQLRHAISAHTISMR